MKSALLALISALLAFSVSRSTAAEAGKVTVTHEAVTSQTRVFAAPGASYGSGTLNEKSSLKRQQIAIHQTALPSDLVGTPTVSTGNDLHSRLLRFEYQTAFEVEVKEPLVAIEVRFLLFDVWGQPLRTLRLTEVRDLPAGRAKLSSTWSILDENDVFVFHAAIGYISRVRTESGRVIEADVEAVLAEARKFSKGFGAENLEPKAGAASPGSGNP